MLTLRVGTKSLQPSLHYLTRAIHATHKTMRERRFRPSWLDHVEDPEDYQPGGFHPVSIGDCFAKERYRVVHKLGFGGSSTVWLARDQKEPGRLVTLKVMRANTSSGAMSESPALTIPRMLRAELPSSVGIQFIDDHFVFEGPNGSHLAVVSPLAGPNVLAMSDCPGRTIGSRRLRADLARKVAKQTATAVYYMHRAGYVHGDSTTSNILFAVSPHVLRWSDWELYVNVGEPETDEVSTCDGSPRPPNAPAELVAPIALTAWHESFFHENVLLSDFGQSYAIASPPPGYKAATIFNYASPETRFEERGGLEADVWMLACAIFEIRAGRPLFESFFGSDSEVLKQTVAMLGRLPDPWWDVFSDHDTWFEEDGEPKSMEIQERDSVTLKISKSSIREQLREIGTQVDAPEDVEGRMIEEYDKRLGEEEVTLLGDLLERMLKYRPEERTNMEEVIRHPWFNFAD